MFISPPSLRSVRSVDTLTTAGETRSARSAKLGSTDARPGGAVIGAWAEAKGTTVAEMAPAASAAPINGPAATRERRRSVWPRRNGVIEDMCWTSICRIGSVR